MYHPSTLNIYKLLQEVAGDATSWNYHAHVFGGPETWHINYTDCGGVSQSPLDIVTKDVIHAKQLELFDLTDYSITDDVTLRLVNKGGHTAELDFLGRDLYLRGGSLPDKYKLVQLHFHWGRDDSRGSEHALDGQHFPMEMHIVHHQATLQNMDVAAPHANGLAVIGFFVDVGQHNPSFDQFLRYFGNITNADQQITIPTFPASSLLPSNGKFDYFRYSGSLTTPPCYESVIWSVSTEHIEISESQLEQFRGLHDSEDQPLVDDFRPLQKLNRRIILTTSSDFNSSAKPGCDVTLFLLTIMTAGVTVLKLL